MKHRILSIAAIFAVFATLMSCQEKTPEVVYSEVPFETISITAGDETVDGVISGTNVTFSFAAVEDFTACSINFEVNEGWTCTWPTDPTNVDLTVDENLVLQFTSPQNAIVKYYISFTSNSLPIADASKIKVAGDPAAVVEVNNAKKTLKIYYNKETMNEAAIELVFEEGALIPGATYEGTAFDFTETLSNPFVIKTSTGDVAYTLKLDKSSLMPNPATLGFTDVTSDYTAKEGITIYTANTLTDVPERQRFYGRSQFVAETPYGPYDGWIYMNGDVDKTVWVALGDWAADRATETLNNVNVAVVLFDEDYVSGKMYCSDDNNVAAGTVSSTVTITGHSTAQGDAGIYADSKFYDDNASATYVNYKNDGFPRTAIAFDANGKFHTATIKYADGKFYEWDRLYTDSGNPIAAEQFAEEINVNQVVWTCPAPVRGNHALTKDELQNSDCGWEPSFGDAWNGLRARMFAGITHDGRVGYAAFQGTFGYIEALGWEDYNAIGTFQAAWVLQKFGFKEVIQIGTAMYGEDGFKPTIIVEGQTLIGDPAQTAAYCIGYDVR